jgi:hypothetical protein
LEALLHDVRDGKVSRAARWARPAVEVTDEMAGLGD